MKKDRINYYESSQEPEYPSWRKGKKNREILLKLLRENVSIEKAASILKLSISQVRRHRRNLISEGLIKIGFPIIIFSGGVYYGLLLGVDDIDFWIEDRIESTILEKVEDLKWEFNQ